MIWHLLQVSDVLDQEFGAALSASVPLIAWKPARTFGPLTALFSPDEPEQLLAEPALRIRSFPLLRGFARPLIRHLIPTASAINRRLLRQTTAPEQSPLIVTVPFFAPVAERWPGPVIYWLTDLIAAYGGAKRRQVEALDARLCRAATLVCPNSTRLADYLLQYAACDPAKLHILPNATRASNLLSRTPFSVGDLPAEVHDLPRPIVGVIGNLAGNMDWELILATARLAPAFHWLFIGPTSMPIADARQSAARDDMTRHPNARFFGARPYGSLAAYARAFDVAMLPYRRREPTYSGSSTRFYEHLAACRPMLATRGFEELLHKEPLLKLINSAEEAAQELQMLADTSFDDGLAAARWSASRNATWQGRAASMRDALDQRLAASLHTQSSLARLDVSVAD